MRAEGTTIVIGCINAGRRWQPKTVQQYWDQNEEYSSVVHRLGTKRIIAQSEEEDRGRTILCNANTRFLRGAQYLTAFKNNMSIN